jgi:hypothetical protein
VRGPRVAMAGERWPLVGRVRWRKSDPQPADR